MRLLGSLKHGRMAGLLGAVSLGALFTFNAFAADRPNVIFLLSDDQSTYTMGCYGAPEAKTPHLDRLAEEGMAFDAHYDTTAICMASRANIMTGMFEYKTGTNFEHGAMMRENWNRSYPVLLRKAGYKVAFAGKFGFEVTDVAGKKGELPEDDFDRWGGGPGQTNYATAKNKSMVAYAKEYPHSSLSYGAFGSDFVKDMAKGNDPFCLSISFKAPHRPTTPDPRFDHVYKDVKFTKPANYGRDKGAHFSKQSTTGRQYERFESWDYDKDYDKVMATYNQQIYAIDYAVGMIRKALEESGTADNTVIIYTSDNGFFNGSHGYGSKVLPYEESSRVPMIIYDPRSKNSGKELRSAALTGNVDFAPTILKLAGVSVPSNMDGGDLLKLYEKPKAKIHDALPLINVWGTKQAQSLSIVTKDWKYIYWPWAGEGFEATEELYHLSKDRLELNNLVNQPEQKRTLEAMRRAYDGAVKTWEDESVPYHGYIEYATIFDRYVDWSEKQTLFEK